MERAGDRDRDSCVEHLSLAFSAGYLTHDEFDALHSTAMESRTIKDLETITSDIPSREKLEKRTGIHFPVIPLNSSYVPSILLMLVSLLAAVLVPSWARASQVHISVLHLMLMAGGIAAGGFGLILGVLKTSDVYNYQHKIHGSRWENRQEEIPFGRACKRG